LIKKEDILNELNKALKASQFLVEIKLKMPDSFVIYIDDFDGLSISECKRINKAVCAAFDRDIDDFELEVSSPGLTKAFKVREQYEKCLNSEIEVVLFDGEKLIGILKAIDENGIILETIIKKNQKTEEVITFNNIKTAKSVIKF
jgi:ribosome maturation factor RimP